LWKSIWEVYVKDWQAHTKEELIIQIISVVIILALGLIAIRILGNKSFAQATLIDMIFIFVLSSTLGALITKPHRIFVAFLVVLTILFFIWLLDKLTLKINYFEKLFVGMPYVIYQDSTFNEYTMRRNNLTVDLLEAAVRSKGIPSLQACKTIVLEPTGAISIEVLPQYEPIKKIYFDAAMQQILKAVDDLKYTEAKLPDLNNLYDEAKGKGHKKDIEIPKHLE
jgi:uncharacterized membrane protein YcaP (DUF421 family)